MIEMGLASFHVFLYNEFQNIRSFVKIHRWCYRNDGETIVGEISKTLERFHRNEGDFKKLYPFQRIALYAVELAFAKLNQLPRSVSLQ